MSQRERCQTCRFCVSTECHRRVPSLDNAMAAVWPMIGPDDWCGEWESVRPEVKYSETSIDEFDLGVRAHNILEAANIETIGQLLQRSECELIGLRGMGEASLQDIKQELRERGLFLKGATQ